MNNSNNRIEKISGTKRDDNRRRAAHTAAEQKRRNAIRVIDNLGSMNFAVMTFAVGF